MLTGLRAQERLVGGGKLGNAVANELVAIVGDVQVWSAAEHNDDGTHKALTTDTLTTTSTVETGGDVNVTGDVNATGAVSAGSGVVKLGGSIGSAATSGAIGPGVEIHGGASGPYVRLISCIESLQRQFVALWNDTETGTLYRPLQVRHETVAGTFNLMPGPITNVTVPCYLGSKFDGSDNGRWTGAYLKNCDSVNGYTERGRTAKIGDYTPVAFNAANFTGVGQTWTVASGNVIEFKFRRTGKTLRGKVFLQATSTGGAGATELDIVLPDGVTAAGRNPGVIWLNMNGTYEWGTTQTSDGGTVLKVFRQDPASTFGSFTGTLGLRGEFEIEVQ